MHEQYLDASIILRFVSVDSSLITKVVSVHLPGAFLILKMSQGCVGLFPPIPYHRFGTVIAKCDDITRDTDRFVVGVYRCQVFERGVQISVIPSQRSNFDLL